MKKITIAFFVLSLMFISNTTLFAQKPTQTKGSSGVGSFTPSNVITEIPSPEEEYRPIPTQDLTPKNVCAPDDDPYGYFCKKGQLYANVGKNCRGARVLSESCTPDSTQAIPDGSDMYCVKGSLPNCNSECVLPFALPNGAECCGDTVCQSGMCNATIHQCQDPLATPTDFPNPDENPTDYFGSTIVFFGAIVVGLFVLLGIKKVVLHAK